MDLHEMSAFLTQTILDNGFDASTWDNLPTKVMFVVTELDEALESTLDVDADPLGEELADVAIRLLVLLNGVFPGAWSPRTSKLGTPRSTRRFETMETSLWPINHHLCQAVESWRYDKRDDTCCSLELALKETFILARDMGVHLENEIRVKADKNASRGKWHGKAKSAG